jgi:type VI secretion system secreted protein VgrG
VARIFPAAKRAAKLRAAAEAAAAVRAGGESNCVQFAPGRRFTLERHFDADGAYLLTAVEHEARVTGDYRADAQDDALDYRNRFTAAPEGLPFRPPRVTPRPIIAGTQTATVVGPPGSQIFLDKYGRVKVQFPWDRQGQANADSSCWIRVAQIWAGKTWGAFFWPRVGHEVVVAFEEGDPDQPIIVGSVYNAANMPPLTLPDEAMRCGIKSCTFAGDPALAFNAVIFHDVPGTEYLQVHSETFQMENTESARYQHTPAGRFTFLGSFPG